MEAFIAVVDQGGFTNAGRKMGISKSAVSKHISMLEIRLGTRLLNRTTRRIEITDIGLAYYDRALRVLDGAREADAVVGSLHSNPAGLLRVSSATDFGVHHLSPIIGPFLDEFPDIKLSILLNDRVVEMASEEFDVALRIGELDEDALNACKLAETTRRMVASPAYLREFGRPESIDDLRKHRLLHHSSQADKAVWRLTARSGEKRHVRTSGGFSVNDGQVLLNAAISGLGIAYLPSFLYAKPMADGLIEDIIPDLPVEVLDIYAVYPRGGLTQPKVRAFIDFLVQQFAGKGPMDW